MVTDMQSYELFPSPFLLSKLIFLIPISETCSHLITTRVLRARSDIRRRQRLAYPAAAIFRMLNVLTNNVISDTRRKSSIEKTDNYFELIGVFLVLIDFDKHNLVWAQSDRICK